ncbi:PAS domain-containing protein [Chelativorans alearense]|uniref:PAS domain-containing protein n=1 Tax=Chelativorans alearense TaxID=2681495 RepID=UPI0013D0E327|nr:PAS domain-containing protein [Chelativorans alearense]
MNQDGSMALFQYWNRLRGNRPAPRRSEIEPADIKALLPDTFILERDARATPVFRLAGTRLCATYGKELKGYSFVSLWSERDQPAVDRLVRHALDEKAVALIAFEGLSRDGRINSFELIVLPLEGGRQSVRALGAVQPLMSPFWLGADPIIENRVESFRLTDPDHEPRLLKNRPSVPVPPLSPEGDALSSRLDDGGRRIRHLVVFQGGKHDV